MGKGKKGKRKGRGHFCWSCNSYRANERFSGKGHKRHLCRDCSKLETRELAYRQALLDLERCVTYEGIIPRKYRTRFQKFLEHADPRIRAFAQELNQEDAVSRAWSMAGRGDFSALEALDQSLESYEFEEQHCLPDPDPFDECNAEVRAKRMEDFGCDLGMPY